MHLGLPFQDANNLYMHIPLEEAFQNEDVGMSFSLNMPISILSYIQGEVNVEVGLPLAY